MAPVLVTGVAGFIGNAVALRLLAEGREVVGLDNLNAYYDPALKRARLARLAHPRFTFHELDLADAAGMEALFASGGFELVVHLAAQAGVRYSIDNPRAYASSNLDGFLAVLEGCRRTKVGHLLYASSSSVYGAVTAMPFSVGQNVDHPVSFYAATKKANELMAHSYSHLYGLPTTGLRFFTVYGPWGRPDMALWLFADAMLAGRPIKVFNHGRMSRDFTFIDDAVELVWRLAQAAPTGDPAWSGDAPTPGSSRAPYAVYNLGNSSPVELGRVVALLEEHLGVEARRENLPMQPGDVPATFADMVATTAATGYAPVTGIEEGVARFAEWFREYRGGGSPLRSRLREPCQWRRTMRWSRELVSFVLDGDQTEDPVATIEVRTPDGLLMIMGEPRQEGRSLIVAGVHLHGVGIDANGVTAVNLRVVVDAFLEAMDYDDIVVEGAVRTSGANPGRRPRPMRFTRRHRPATEATSV